ncbi:hypothetical protein DPMN_180112 [Dreissena polymorpha]|uniref:Uncharacterized protein n=1 Tax=Dreissena polymorpha TaxID=45954 RepID=A0A9D4IMY1_DREPO|nr:hypothetical protein DPMN_180112 [Dreissena polymorpha]
MLPDRTLAKRTDDQKTLGFKQAKKPCHHSAVYKQYRNHKLPPLGNRQVRQAKMLPSSEHVDAAVVYDHSANAWMTSAIF